MDRMEDQKFEILDIDEFASRLNISRATVFEWKKRGILKAGRDYLSIGRVLRFYWSEETIKTFMAKTAILEKEAAKPDSKQLKSPQRRPTSGKRSSAIDWEY
jgi:hypothetical protein